MENSNVPEEARKKAMEAITPPPIPAEPEVMDQAYDYTTYLIGAMEKTAQNDDGGGMRSGVEKELTLRNVFPINPVKLESSKTGLPTGAIKEKLSGWIASGNWEKFKEKSREIWKGKLLVEEDGSLVNVPGDIDYCKMSDWITFTYNRGDVPCGSFAECGIAMDHGIPIYLITNMPKKELPKSLLQMIMVTEGEVFNTLNEYLEFIDKKYKLRRSNAEN
jgi:hypothetical protein